MKLLIDTINNKCLCFNDKGQYIKTIDLKPGEGIPLDSLDVKIEYITKEPLFIQTQFNGYILCPKCKCHMVWDDNAIPHKKVIGISRCTVRDENFTICTGIGYTDIRCTGTEHNAMKCISNYCELYGKKFAATYPQVILREIQD